MRYLEIDKVSPSRKQTPGYFIVQHLASGAVNFTPKSGRGQTFIFILSVLTEELTICWTRI